MEAIEAIPIKDNPNIFSFLDGF